MTTRRVVVIDSGVDPRHPALRAHRIVPGPAFGPAGALCDGDGGTDRLGHGTAVAATLVRFLAAPPPVEIVSLRVFDREPVCDFTAVLHALAHALTLRPALVNLSLGTTSLRYRRELAALAAAAKAQGTR
ncbi:MAG: S8/S53 family peptidase, partial [Planctomycetota bacterium]